MPPAPARPRGGNNVVKDRVAPRKEVPPLPRERSAPALDVELTVGDRVHVKVSDRTVAPGVVMYVSKTTAGVVGVKLDSAREGLGDGKASNGEQHFRCPIGHGAYVSSSRCTKMKPASQQPRQPASQPAQPPASPQQPAEKLLPTPPRRKPATATFDLERAMEDIVGLESVKDTLRSLRNRLVVGRRRAAFGVVDDGFSRTFLFVGADGSDFKPVGVVLAAMLHDLGVLGAPRCVAVKKHELVKTSTATTVAATTAVVADLTEAGGLLLVEEASGLVVATADARGDQAARNSEYAKIAFDALVAASAAAAGANNYAICLTARVAHQAALLRAAPAIAPLTFEFAEYSLDEVALLLRREVAKRGFELDDDVKEIISLAYSRAGPDQGGCVMVKAIVDEAVRRQTNRVYANGTISKKSLLSLTAADFRGKGEENAQAEKASIRKALGSLDSIIGLSGVKEHVRALAAQIELDGKRRLLGLRAMSSSSQHMIFQGNPGTGKTTVARMVAEIMRSLGKLRRGHLVEVDRAGLVAAYQGQTALKVNEVVNSALGGLLFVDEAYSLVKDAKDSFGREALDALIKKVEDHRDDLVVVFAGYTDEMGDLLRQNPGLRSRFPTVINFEDYNPDELMLIAEQMLGTMGPLKASESAKTKMHAIFEQQIHADDNGNGRAVRNMLEQAARRQALRVQKIDKTINLAHLETLDEADFVDGTPQQKHRHTHRGSSR